MKKKIIIEISPDLAEVFFFWDFPDILSSR